MTESVRKAKAEPDTEMDTVRAALRILERDLAERNRWTVRLIIRQWINERRMK
jgi:hypothetical protein